MKGLFQTIFEYLTKVGARLDGIPDFGDLSQRVGRLERGHTDLQNECTRSFKELRENLDMLETNHGERIQNHEVRIKKIEEQLADFSIDAIFQRDEFKSLRRAIE